MTDTELRVRLEKLERDNRRLKRLGAAALVLAAVLGFMAATRPVPDVIKAHEFDLVDNQGRKRAELSMHLTPSTGDARIPGIVFLGPKREKLASLTSNSYSIFLHSESGAFSPTSMTLTNDNLTFYSLKGSLDEDISVNLGRFLDGWGLRITGPHAASLRMTTVDPGPLVELSDAQGFSMDLGSTGMVRPATGATQQTSAASIVMFGNDKKHHVIWKAP